MTDLSLFAVVTAGLLWLVTLITSVPIWGVSSIRKGYMLGLAVSSMLFVVTLSLTLLWQYIFNALGGQGGTPFIAGLGLTFFISATPIAFACFQHGRLQHANKVQ